MKKPCTAFLHKNLKQFTFCSHILTPKGPNWKKRKKIIQQNSMFRVKIS